MYWQLSARCSLSQYYLQIKIWCWRWDKRLTIAWDTSIFREKQFLVLTLWEHKLFYDDVIIWKQYNNQTSEVTSYFIFKIHRCHSAEIPEDNSGLDTLLTSLFWQEQHTSHTHRHAIIAVAAVNRPIATYRFCWCSINLLFTATSSSYALPPWAEVVKGTVVPSTSPSTEDPLVVLESLPVSLHRWA